MKCFECDGELKGEEVSSGRIYQHERYAGKHKPLCKYCRKPFKMNTMRTWQHAIDADRRWKHEASKDE